ncbi:hypothetical protein FHG87_000893 [Trinorchestia longiramus]|nr:hypothetical protein FHG87_000893 [Trinorchestia longiramus]
MQCLQHDPYTYDDKHEFPWNLTIPKFFPVSFHHNSSSPPLLSASHHSASSPSAPTAASLRVSCDAPQFYAFDQFCPWGEARAWVSRMYIPTGDPRRHSGPAPHTPTSHSGRFKQEDILATTKPCFLNMPCKLRALTSTYPHTSTALTSTYTSTALSSTYPHTSTALSSTYPHTSTAHNPEDRHRS